MQRTATVSAISVFLLLFVPLTSLYAQQGGYIDFSDPEITQDASLDINEAEFVFVCIRNDIVINNALSIDRVDAYPKSRNGRYEYTVHLQLKASNGDFQRDRTFVFGIKNTSITEEYKKKSIMGGRRYTVRVDVVDQFIAMLDRTPDVSVHLNEAEACVVFRSLLELDIRATDSRLAKVSKGKNPSGLNEYEVVIFISQQNDGSNLFVSARGESSNVLSVDVSQLHKREKKVYEVFSQRAATTESTSGSRTIQQQYVVIQVEPQTSIVTFNGEVLPVTNGSAQKLVPFGTYDYKVECADYHTQTGTLRVDDTNTVFLSVGLKANYGWIDIEGKSVEGANIYIDKYPVGTAPYHSDKLSSGKHSVMIMKPRYKTSEQIVEVRDGEHTRITPTLDADFATVTFVVAKNADIYIDGKLVGRAMVKDDFPTGYHTVDTYLEGCRTQSRMYNITSDMMGQTVSLPTPTPIYGTLSISSDPIGAIIAINSKSCGRTPKMINTMEVGEYAVTLSLTGYETYKTRVTVQEDEQTKVEAGLTVASSWASKKNTDGGNKTNTPTQNLSSSKALEKYVLTLKCNTSIVKLYLDGELVGQGSTTMLVPEGEHVLKAKATGYSTYNEVIQMDRDITRIVNLKKKSYFKVEIMCDAPYSEVMIDGEAMKPDANGRYTLCDGRHSLFVSANLCRPYSENIDIKNDTIIRVSLQSNIHTKNIIPSVNVKAGNVSFNMIYVKGGTFSMGSNLSSDEQPVHTVLLDNYYVSEIEVTQELWRAVMHDIPNNVVWSDEIGIGDNYPAYGISYEDAIAFVKHLSKMTGKKFRLPTEAEWEYAARGGGISRNYIYSGSNTLSEVAVNNLQNVFPVKSKHWNELGIFDMSGNVSELCDDWYGINYNSVSPRRKPKGPDNGNMKVIRGGCWSDVDNSCRVAHRDYSQPSSSNPHVGIRLVMQP